MYTKAKDNAKNTTPKKAVTFCINASKPRGFCLLNNSVAPPDKAEDALSVLAGCIKTAIMINTDTINKSVKSILYNPNLPPYPPW